VSGIPSGWNRSAYNRRSDARKSLPELIDSLRARYILLSYNSEGFISPAEITETLAGMGTLSMYSTDYNTFRGCRNLNARNPHVKEYLFLLEKR